MKFYKGNIQSLPSNGVFVFGSNLQGIHGAGAAKVARAKYGAKQGCGLGFQGQSYALPTKDTPYRSLSLFSIKQYVHFLELFIKNNPQYEYFITPVGCGLAGHKAEDIAPMFIGVNGDNINYSEEWREYLES